MADMTEMVRDCLSQSPSRVEFWTRFLQAANIVRVAEIGVFRGDFASALLTHCPAIQHYYLLDPWRHLDDWNKPANRDDDTFHQFYQETLQKVDFAKHKTIVLRGTTTEVIDRIPDGDLDFLYIDGDHTLRGITIDLIKGFAKVRPGGWIGGDDLSATIWQHHAGFEPSLVFPFVIYFAEAVGARVYALPHKQFLLAKLECPSFEFCDLAGAYHDTSLRSQFSIGRLWKPKLAQWLPFTARLRKNWNAQRIAQRSYPTGH